MANISVRIPAANIEIGEAEVSVQPFAVGTLSTAYDSVDSGTHNIAAGAYKVEVYNDGLNVITVNGQDIPTGNTYLIEAIANPATQRMDLTPALTIVVPSGGAASYYVLRPSS